MYESSKLNEDTRRFYPVTVTNDASGITVTDQVGNTANVVLTDGLYNNICREYWMSVSTSPKGVRATRSLISSSHAVVHQIDAALIYGEEMQMNWSTAMRQ